MKCITCLKCKIKYNYFYNICNEFNLKDKCKEEYNEECCLKVIDDEIIKMMNSYHDDLFNSFTSVDDFINDSKVYNLGD